MSRARLHGGLGRILVVLLWLTSLSQAPALEQKGKAPEAEQTMPEVRDLFPSETIHFAAPPPLMVDSGIKCDHNGNIYLVYSDSPQVVLAQPSGPALLPIQRLSLKSRTTTQYAIPSITGYQGLHRYDLAVDADGRVYALLSDFNNRREETHRSGYLIVKYGADGTMDSYSEFPDSPDKRLQPLRLAAFADGTFLVTGTVLQAGELGAFASIFGRGATFLADVQLPGDVKPTALKPAPSSPAGATGQAASPTAPESASAAHIGHPSPAGEHRNKVTPASAVSGELAASAPDGNIYLLRATDPPQVYVVSPAGEVVRRFEADSPSRDLSPIQMAMAGDDKLFIEFAHVATGAPGENETATKLIAVLDTQTGHVDALYRLGPADTGVSVAACASSPYSFSFVGTGEDNKLTVTTYSPRVY